MFKAQELYSEGKWTKETASELLLDVSIKLHSVNWDGYSEYMKVIKYPLLTIPEKELVQMQSMVISKATGIPFNEKDIQSVLRLMHIQTKTTNITLSRGKMGSLARYKKVKKILVEKFGKNKVHKGAGWGHEYWDGILVNCTPIEAAKACREIWENQPFELSPKKLFEVEEERFGKSPFYK